MNLKSCLLILTLVVIECAPVHSEEPTPPCVIKSGERVDLRDLRLRDPTCVIEQGVTLSLFWDEYTGVAIKKADVIVTPSCSDESRGVILEQTAREKLDTMQTLPIEINRVEKSCVDKARVDVVITETGK